MLSRKKRKLRDNKLPIIPEKVSLSLEINNDQTRTVQFKPKNGRQSINYSDNQDFP